MAFSSLHQLAIGRLGSFYRDSTHATSQPNEEQKTVIPCQTFLKWKAWGWDLCCNLQQANIVPGMHKTMCFKYFVAVLSLSFGRNTPNKMKKGGRFVALYIQRGSRTSMFRSHREGTSHRMYVSLSLSLLVLQPCCWGSTSLSLSLFSVLCYSSLLSIVLLSLSLSSFCSPTEVPKHISPFSTSFSEKLRCCLPLQSSMTERHLNSRSLRSSH